MLRETNANLHTFEFMLGQYRQLAKISPFNIVPPAGAGGGSDDVIMEQLKQLSSAVDRMTGSEGGGDGGSTLAEIQSLRKQVDSLQQANDTAKVRFSWLPYITLKYSHWPLK